MPRSLMRRYYFPVASLSLVALTLIAFSDNLFTDVDQPSNRDPKFIVHGLLCGAWMIVLFVQTTLIAAGNVRLHRTVGIAAIAIAVGVTLSTIWVFVAVWDGWATMSPEVKGNRLLLPSYSVAVALGYLQRRRPDRHKRFVYAGTLFMLEPVLARVYDPLVVPLLRGMSTAQVDALFLPWMFAVWLAFFASWLAYDWLTIRRFHAITIGALLWFGLMWAIAFGTPGPAWNTSAPPPTKMTADSQVVKPFRAT
ncbi:hypothetical protein FPZ24_14575 [Sphingomonas panacisoli]|uniref:Uncharacterized protein n=1 Tax=Sphingomonas panacisoli TaxID=1813879 RepID=A0A5B8LM73_9SPHN|nr:hypothetical protein [Sphingomonas panacisoli]QDZ08542.1 hypothetical protein FPZ24_14575 [Sphingomonas panacisoli]